MLPSLLPLQRAYLLLQEKARKIGDIGIFLIGNRSCRQPPANTLKVNTKKYYILERLVKIPRSQVPHGLVYFHASFVAEEQQHLLKARADGVNATRGIRVLNNHNHPTLTAEQQFPSQLLPLLSLAGCQELHRTQMLRPMPELSSTAEICTSVAAQTPPRAKRQGWYLQLPTYIIVLCEKLSLLAHPVFG